MTSSDRDGITIGPADPREPDARTCLAAYFRLLTERIDGLTPAHVPDPDPDAGRYRPPDGTLLLARRAGVPVGCVALKTIAPETGEVKRLWVHPSARGLGLARRLMRALEDEARTLGLARLQLDTNGALTEAIALYRADGWTDIPAYTGWPATLWFGKTL